MKKKHYIVISIIVVFVLASIFILFPLKKASEVIKIGAILPLTGENAKYGESAKNSIDLAIEEINSGKGINGKKISVIFEDSKGNTKEGVNAIKKLIIANKVSSIIGAMASSITLAIAPIAEESEVVLLSPASSAPEITHAGDYIFRNCYSDIYEGSKMANYIYNETVYRKVSIIHINNDYGMGLREAFREEFKRLGGKVVSIETYDFGATDFRTQIGKLMLSRPDAIYIVGYGEMGRLLIQTKELGCEIPFFSCIMFEDPDIIEISGEISEGIIYTFPSFDTDSKKNVVEDFVNSYKSKYNERPDGFAANTYDALKILSLAIKKGGDKGYKIKEALYTIKDYPGVTGKTSFDINGDVVKPIGIKTVENGKFKWVVFEY